ANRYVTMVIYQKLLPRTKKRGVFYLSLKISLLNRLASYDEYPPGVHDKVYHPPIAKQRPTVAPVKEAKSALSHKKETKANIMFCIITELCILHLNCDGINFVTLKIGRASC